MSFDVLEFDQFDDVLSSTDVFEANRLYYLYSIVYRGSEWELLEDTMISFQEGTLSIGLNQHK